MVSSSIYSIYKATNIINGKSYIGFTNDFEHRKKQHWYDRQLKRKFYNAIRKYGWDNFVWEIIYQSKDVNYTLNVMESYFIEQYDSYKNGYNSSKGGEGNLGFTHSYDTREKISKALTGRKIPEQTKKNMSAGQLKRVYTEEWGQLSSLRQKGVKKSEEIKNKISKTLKNITPNCNSVMKRCPHCHREFNMGNYSRWHGDNCKSVQYHDLGHIKTFLL